MTDPTRWRDGADDLPDDVRASLLGAHGPSRPSAGERAAMVAFATKLGALPPPSLHPLARLGGWKVIGLAGLVTAVGATTIPLLRHRASEHAATMAAAHVNAVEVPVSAMSPSASGSSVIERPVAVTATPAPTVIEAPVAEPSVVHVAAIAPTVHTVTRPRVNATASSEHAASSAPTAPACPVALRVASDEERVIRAAMGALTSDPAVTLACVRSLSAHGAPSELRDEYWFLGFEASRRLGHTAEARQWGQSLLQGAADSPYAGRVRQWIAGTSAP